MSFVTHLECGLTGERSPADRLQTVSAAGKPLLVRYDLQGVRQALTKDALAGRPPDFWRYRELLPVRKAGDVVSLGEAITPLVRLPRIAARLGCEEILVKDEGRLPTGSFKARGLALAVSMAKALGIRHMAMPTNGNAGAALAAYASRAGIRTTVFCPDDTPEVNVSEIDLKRRMVGEQRARDARELVGARAGESAFDLYPSRIPTHLCDFQHALSAGVIRLQEWQRRCQVRPGEVGAFRRKCALLEPPAPRYSVTPKCRSVVSWADDRSEPR